MEYTEEILSKVAWCGTLGFPLCRILNVVEVEDEEQFKEDFNNPQSRVYRMYQKGKDKADYVIDKKLFDMASNGDMRALEKFEERKSYNLINSEKK